MIAHRLSTITNANRIFVLKDDKIVEFGNNMELIEKGGLYAHMWKQYNVSSNWKVGGIND